MIRLKYLIAALVCFAIVTVGAWQAFTQPVFQHLMYGCSGHTDVGTICEKGTVADSVLCRIAQRMQILIGGQTAGAGSALRTAVLASPSQRLRVFNYWSMTEHRTTDPVNSADAKWKAWVQARFPANWQTIYEGIYLHFSEETTIRYWRCQGCNALGGCPAGSFGCGSGQNPTDPIICTTKTFPAYDSNNPVLSRVPHPGYAGFLQPCDIGGVFQTEFDRELLNWRNNWVFHAYLEFLVTQIYKQELPGGSGSGPYFRGIFADNAQWGLQFLDFRTLTGGGIKEADDFSEAWVAYDCNFEIGDYPRGCDTNENDMFNKWYRNQCQWSAFMKALDDTLALGAAYHQSATRGWLLRNGSLGYVHSNPALNMPQDSVFTQDLGDLLFMEFEGTLIRNDGTFPERMRQRNNLSSSNDIMFSANYSHPAGGTAFGCNPPAATCLPFGTVLMGDLAFMHVVRDKDPTDGWGSPYWGRQNIYCGNCGNQFCGACPPCSAPVGKCCNFGGGFDPCGARYSKCVDNRTWISAFATTSDPLQFTYMGTPVSEATTLFTAPSNGFTAHIYRRDYDQVVPYTGQVNALAYVRARDAGSTNLDSLLTRVSVRLPTKPTGKVWRSVLLDGTVASEQYGTGDTFLIANARGALFIAVTYDSGLPCKPKLCEELN